MSDEKDNQGNSSDVVTENNEEREGMLEELFDNMRSSSSAEQSTMRTLFNADTFNSSTNHSPMLQRGRHKEKVASPPEGETLTDQVMRIVGRR